MKIIFTHQKQIIINNLGRQCRSVEHSWGKVGLDFHCVWRGRRRYNRRRGNQVLQKIMWLSRLSRLCDYLHVSAFIQCLCCISVVWFPNPLAAGSQMGTLSIYQGHSGRPVQTRRSRGRRRPSICVHHGCQVVVHLWIWLCICVFINVYTCVWCIQFLAMV